MGIMGKLLPVLALTLAAQTFTAHLTGTITAPSGSRDTYNIHLERSVGSFDVPQRAVITFAIQLPFGRGKRFFNKCTLADSRDWSNAYGCTKPRFSPAAFTTTPEFQIPIGPRFLPNVREGWLRSIDGNLQKSVFITEGIRLSLQLRALNVLNQFSFSGPGVFTVGQANLGAAGGVFDNARRAEVGATIYF